MKDLEELGRLKDLGLLTDEEFETGRQEIFSQRPTATDPADDDDADPEEPQGSVEEGEVASPSELDTVTDSTSLSELDIVTGNDETTIDSVDNWWQASDGLWYPPEALDALKEQGWFQGGDGQWYPPPQSVVEEPVVASLDQSTEASSEQAPASIEPAAEASAITHARTDRTPEPDEPEFPPRVSADPLIPVPPADRSTETSAAGKESSQTATNTRSFTVLHLAVIGGLFVAVAVIVMVFALSGSSTGDSVAFASGRMLFNNQADGHLYEMSADGSEVRQLTDDGKFSDGSAVWSPDGESIAFTRYHERLGWTEIFVMNADGSEVRQLTDNYTNGLAPAWSPDGESIAFLSYQSISPDIFVMNADGSEVRQLTNNDDDEGVPVWSPDGESIAFSRSRYNDDGYVGSDIFVMNADGSGWRQLTNNHAGFSEPVWSPDGESIAFESARDGDFEIFVMNADGSEVRQLTNNDDDDADPVWSPDGESIAFTRSRLGRPGDGYDGFDIFVMNADGSEERRLTSNDDLETDVMWSPDGGFIAFSSGQVDNFQDFEIFVMNADGSGVYSTGQQGRLSDWSAPTQLVGGSSGPDTQKCAALAEEIVENGLDAMEYQAEAMEAMMNFDTDAVDDLAARGEWALERAQQADDEFMALGCEGYAD